ncbi:GTP-binding protein TypA/BipA [Planctomycetes bacterium Pla163]|uniref:Large ribosomal subunit assembly factor BipA n=1 Tax=Rohdeia mirabilis TaxID=2528008 RepID=A0A518CXW0_9BACT|nr:GTP-binding protein TypA/BipA [Planctomycetes bacterium Pla163]
MTETINIAIVAHVDHGKTTLVDAMFRFAGTFRSNQVMQERVMDSDAQERERGITILAKNTAIDYQGRRINIIDTPGHADFGGQVERTLGMADAVLLLVDSFEGPMPQTRFVLSKAFERGLKALVMVNKIDRPDERAAEVLDEVFDLFVELGATDEQLEFPVCYGSGRDGWAVAELGKRAEDLRPLFAMITNEVKPLEADPEGPLQFQAVTIDHDDFVGRIGVGRVVRGTIQLGARLMLCNPNRPKPVQVTVKNLYRYEGLAKVAVDRIIAGDVAVVAGIEELAIGDTLCPADAIEPLPPIHLDEPTISMVFQVNDSPFAGKEGDFVTSRQVAARLEKEALRDAALQIAPTERTDSFEVKGRGVMHLSVLIENMRREGYEFAVGKPRVIVKEIDGVKCEPMERATVDVPGVNAGRVIEFLGRRRGELLEMDSGEAMTHLEFRIPARGLIGARTALLSLTQGEAILGHLFDGWEPDGGTIPRRNGGVLVSDRSGGVMAYALDGLSDRGKFFIKPGDEVYGGMIVGETNKPGDLEMNVCRAKKLTNMRASGKDDNALLTPPKLMSLEEFLEYIEDDELLEVTPKSLRLRKRSLDPNQRRKDAKALRV